MYLTFEVEHYINNNFYSWWENCAKLSYASVYFNYSRLFLRIHDNNEQRKMELKFVSIVWLKLIKKYESNDIAQNAEW